jgi:methionyl-tRNA formyltransferase
VKSLALSLGLPLSQPRSLRLDGRFPDDAAQARAWLQALAPQAMVVAAYGLILPPWTLALPLRGCLNIHASLLPRWRGAAPIQRAIEAGDAVTGVAIMQMDAGLDTGDVLLEATEPIGPDDTAGSLHDRLASLGAALIVQALKRLSQGGLTPRPQPALGVTYAAKIDKAQALIDWREPAALIERRVRAFDPVPGAAFDWQGERIKLWRARVLTADELAQALAAEGAPLEALTEASEQASEQASAVAKAVASVVPGQPVDIGAARLAFGTGDGVLECLVIQRPGGRRSSVADWLRGAGARGGGSTVGATGSSTGSSTGGPTGSSSQAVAGR